VKSLSLKFEKAAVKNSGGKSCDSKFNKVRVILVTDGDRVAQKAVEDIAKSLNLRCISASAGNPTPISGPQIVSLLKEAHHDPVLVMFDDRGKSGKFLGECALEFVASHPDINVLGAVAVASNTSGIDGIEPDICIDSSGRILKGVAVNKKGQERCDDKREVIAGDTVDVLNNLDVPFIVGIGDVGKMDKADDIARGCPITRQAIEEILIKNGVEYGQQ
jgi:stage V sporulation protein AE